MTRIGQVLRSLLNINAIWGLMILSAFLLCVAQHYLPTTTVIPASGLVEGENTGSIQVVDRKGQTREFVYALVVRGEELSLPARDAQANADTPRLISVRRAGSHYVLKWDTPATGKYKLLIGQRVVAQGRLVTLQSLTDAAFDYAKTGFDIALGLVASLVLFLGLMRVGQDAGIVQLVARLLHPVIRLLFPDVPKDHPASGAIVMNWTTTILGLGNAATPFGLKAMKELQSLNPQPEVATDAQVMLLGYNTAGFALLPTTLLALRKSAGCGDPFEIIGTCMVAGAVSMLTAIVMVKVLGRLGIFSRQAALGEAADQTPRPATAGSASAAQQ